MRPKKKLLVIVGIPVAVVAVVAISAKLRAARPVELSKLSRGSIVEAVYGIGTVTSNKIYNVKVGQAGTIRGIYVKEGDVVDKGAKLLNLEGIVFAAPFKGTVVSLPFKTGETVFPQVPLLTLQDQSDVYVVVSLEQQGALRVKAGQTARISFDSIRDKTFSGKVRTIFSNESQFLVHIDVDSLPPEVLPGMTGDVGIIIAKREQALLAPVAAIDGDKLKVIRDNRLVEVPIRIGSVDGEMAEIISGEVSESESLTLGVPKKK